MDPAVYGLIGTALGAAIGFAGTWLSSRKTAEATAGREVAARLFAERRKTYAAAFQKFAETKTALFFPILRGPAEPYNQFRKRRDEVMAAYSTIYNDTLIIGSKQVRDTCIAYNKMLLVLIGEAEELARKSVEDRVKATDDMRDEHSDNLDKLHDLFGQLGTAMRDDLGIPD